jgi:hypothetical protein
MLRNKKKFMVLIASATLLYNGYVSSSIVKAEGSRELVNNYNSSTGQYVNNGGYRPFLWSSDATTAGITRRTTFKVYAKEGETLNFGSSVAKAGSIMVKKPGAASWTYKDVSSTETKVGYIENVTQEKIGPNVGGYNPIVINVGTGETGTWEFQFTGDESKSGNPTFQKGSEAFIGEQTNTIAAWDVTVKDLSGNEVKGRMFTPYIAMIMGNNSDTNNTASNSQGAEKVLNNDFYVLTKDGYVYQTSMNGIDPNGFVFWSNNRGFIDKTNNKTLYHSVDGGNDNVSTGSMVEGNLGPQLPTVADTETDITHKVFINKPNSDLPAGLSPVAIAPEIPGGFTFKGNSNVEHQTKITEGGTFSFTAKKASTYRLIIDTDGTNGYNLASDIVIENVSRAGTNTITWNGKDKAGNTLPVGTYKAQLIMKGGEYHFPMLDAEHNPFGIKVKLINAPLKEGQSDYADKYKVYYDENNYTTNNGKSVNLDSSNSKYNINPINGLAGVDSSNGAHAYFQNYGNWKGIDTWTYYPGDAVALEFDVTPAVSNISKSGLEDTNISFTTADFSNKFTDGASNTLNKIKITSIPANGELLFNGTPVAIGQEIATADLNKLIFIPKDNWNGSTSFDWNGSDGTFYSANAAKVNITIASVNDVPTSVSDTAATDEDVAVDINVIGNDTDADGDHLYVTEVTSPGHGTAVISEDGTIIRYTPDANYSGPDSFTYTISDGKGGTATATVNIVVSLVNDAPTVAGTSITISEDEQYTGTLPPVSDVDSNTFVYELVEAPTHGTIVLNSNGTYTYIPETNYNGPDSFKFKVNDGQSYSNVATVNITVTQVNDLPQAPNYSKNTNYNTAVSGKVIGTDVDGDILTYSKGSNPSKGVVTVNSDATWTYTPNTGATGSDSFTILVSDGRGGSVTSFINITIDTPPTVPNYNKATYYNRSVLGTVVGEDTDSGDVLTYSKGIDPQKGTVIVNYDGTWLYTPNEGATGIDSFTVVVSDGHGASATSVIGITIDTPPTIPDYNNNANYNAQVSGKASGNDVDRDTLTYSKGSEPSKGNAVVDSDGNWRYTPNPGAVGTDSFTIVVDDGRGGIATSVISITIDTPPTVADYNMSINYNALVSGAVVGSDADKDLLTYSKGSDPSKGIVKVNSDGTWVYTPNAGATGTDSFTIVVVDGHGGSATSLINITIDTPPTVPNYNKTTFYNRSVLGTVIGKDTDSGDTLTYTKGIDPIKGTAIVNSDGTWIYTPNTGATGSDSFTVVVRDGHGGSAISIIRITIITDDSKNINFNTPVSGIASGSDIDGDTLTYSKGSSPTKGTAAVDSYGNWTYTPNPGATGKDSFTIVVSDGCGGSTTSNISITIDTPPTVPNYQRTTPYNTSLTGMVSAVDVDNDNLTYSLNSAPANGHLELNSSSGGWVYIPSLNFVGTDSFKVEVRDGHGGSSISNIEVTVKDKLTLIGTITDKDTNRPLPNTKVELRDLSGKLIYSTIADASGNYIINNVKLGLYRFNVANSQYANQNVNVDVQPASETEYTIRRDFKLVKSISYAIKLDANPITIVGDGISTSVLTARVTDSNNKVVSNAKVIFSAPSGSFPNGREAMTDENGIATVVFKSAKIEGTAYKIIPVTASVDDDARNLHASDQIYVTFEPGSIVGIIVDNDTKLPVSGAVVEVAKDFDSDGIADFYSKVVTGTDGKYSIAIPRGNVQYDITITKPVKVGNNIVQVKYKQSSVVGEITGTGNEKYLSDKTAAGIILTKQTDGGVSFLNDYSNFSINVVNKADLADIYSGKAVLENIEGVNAYIRTEIGSNGVFQAEGLEKGKDYTFVMSYTLPNGKKVIVSTVDVNVNMDGEMNLGSALIDPYGTITDAITHNIIVGANVKLYYADTARNRAAGIVPNTLVNLPGVAGFEPADNKNPQLDDALGKYAFMVFPDTDYYIVVEKDGYETYISETISVGKEIVKKDIEMNAKPGEVITLPKTGSPIDMAALGTLGFIILASGVGLTLKPKKNK